MKLDPQKALSPATIQAMVDLFPPLDETQIDDDSILRVAMGVADAATRHACAFAVLADPEVGSRLARARRQVVSSLQSLRPDRRQIEDLRCLAVFAAPFTPADAAAVFPDRFGRADDFLPFEARGWLESGREEDTGTFHLSASALALASVPIEEEVSPDWRTRFALHFAEVTSAVDRTLSELRWVDASIPLRRHLPDLRRAWAFADELDMFEMIERFARSLMVAFLELGAIDDFEDLLQRGFRAADALKRPKFRSWLLSFQGVAAARCGDPVLAREIWWTRVKLNRSIPNPVGEADALLDIAASHHTAGDHEAFRALVDDLDRAVAAAEHADLEARFLALLAVDRLRADDPDTAILHAQKALSVLSGVDGIDMGLSVRFSAAKTLSGCGQTWGAFDSLTEILSVCVDSGRSVAAAFSLAEIASHLEVQENQVLALQCLEISLSIHRQVGTRYSEAVESRVLTLRRVVPSDPSRLIGEAFGSGPWEAGCLVILAEIARIRALAIPSR